MLVALHVAALTLDPRDGRAVLLLVHRPSERLFPIWLDDRDAAAIARALTNQRASPPDPQDLGASLLDVTGARVEHAALLGVVGSVVRARLVVRYGDETVPLDARVSDAVAIALRQGAELLVDEGLLEQVAARVRDAESRISHAHPTGAEPVAQSVGERWNQLLEHLSSGPEGPLYEA